MRQPQPQPRSASSWSHDADGGVPGPSREPGKDAARPRVGPAPCASPCRPAPTPAATASPTGPRQRSPVSASLIRACGISACSTSARIMNATVNGAQRARTRSRRRTRGRRPSLTRRRGASSEGPHGKWEGPHGCPSSAPADARRARRRERVLRAVESDPGPDLLQVRHVQAGATIAVLAPHTGTPQAFPMASRYGFRIPPGSPRCPYGQRCALRPARIRQP